METEIKLVCEPIAENIPPPTGLHGAWLEFRGVVRGEEDGQSISALEYEAYPEMAERQIRCILESLASKSPCLVAKVIHRTGVIPVGEAAIYVGVASGHRREAIVLLAEFMNRFKQDVPVWKRRALPTSERSSVSCSTSQNSRAIQGAVGQRPALRSFDEAQTEIRTRCQPLPGVHTPLAECFGRVLRETISASTDSPDYDRSTRDGYAILQNDESETYTVVDTLDAADWKPRQLKPGEAVRIATGAALPCDNLRVVMQEHVERNNDKIRIMKRDRASNIRRRGEDTRAGQLLVSAGARLDAGKLALLASAGCARPSVSPCLHIVHFTTGDEIVSPEHRPGPGQIRDSNSTLIRGLLQKFPCELIQAHLPEDYEMAKSKISVRQSVTDNADLLLVSGGASVGDKDFTRSLLQWLGFEIVFSQVNVRPGQPLIFGINGSRVAFGLPGNPLSHFVCFHLFVAMALAKLIGEGPKGFLRSKLAAKLNDALNPRETLWPARLDPAGLRPLAWASSGDVTCLAEINALIRVPANQASIEPGAEVEYLLTADNGINW